MVVELLPSQAPFVVAPDPLAILRMRELDIAGQRPDFPLGVAVHPAQRIVGVDDVPGLDDEHAEAGIRLGAQERFLEGTLAAQRLRGQLLLRDVEEQAEETPDPSRLGLLGDEFDVHQAVAERRRGAASAIGDLLAGQHPLHQRLRVNEGFLPDDFAQVLADDAFRRESEEFRVARVGEPADHALVGADHGRNVVGDQAHFAGLAGEHAHARVQLLPEAGLAVQPAVLPGNGRGREQRGHDQDDAIDQAEQEQGRGEQVVHQPAPFDQRQREDREDCAGSGDHDGPASEGPCGHDDDGIGKDHGRAQSGDLHGGERDGQPGAHQQEPVGRRDLPAVQREQAGQRRDNHQERSDQPALVVQVGEGQRQEIGDRTGQDQRCRQSDDVDAADAFQPVFGGQGLDGGLIVHSWPPARAQHEPQCRSFVRA
ncbi:MAG: hypothetical protein ROZ00_16220 [Denitratisoma sp.]|nr:hypothetical protein [Denitratisoma sp.]